MVPLRRGDDQCRVAYCSHPVNKICKRLPVNALEGSNSADAKSLLGLPSLRRRGRGRL